ncbi:MAG: hypothetical protein HFI85_05115 [Clostridia bacterium]|jgi:hypothetical protein|nr:hypothetical protein [Clostridia bacterium]
MVSNLLVLNTLYSIFKLELANNIRLERDYIEIELANGKFIRLSAKFLND